ncbi:diguanylate cyclase domain-containing protein [Lysinibacillus sp. BW-2-10]|uniref:diguanylate cyclase domain-containing protein n=1 Tax=Lysinibacillus sp. BW-2-10 TaxID=2590030 RepID=UPI00118125EA|nr:diguanylate cyclase [Lysinibacillus sp. BW-2-10]TSI02613.1 diguanylate cyclase [Lysinibacillus sp. BW-2-10]
MSLTILPKEQFELLFGKSNDFVYYLEKNEEDYKYIYINKKSLQLLSEDAIGKNMTEIMNKGQYELIIEHYNLALEKKEQVNYEDYSYVDSEVRKYETSVLPIIHDGKECILAITKEISFDRDLQDKYLFMRSVFFNTFLSTVLISSDGRLLEANPQFLQDFNLDIEEVRWQYFVDLPITSNQEPEQLKLLLKEACEGKNLSSKLLSFVDKEGAKRSFSATFSPIYQNDQESTVVGIFIILQEITDFLQQEKQLRITSNGLSNFKYAINSTAEVSLTDLEGVIIEVNERFIEQSGYSREELIGNTHKILNSRFHSAEFFKNLWDTIQNGDVWRGEICNRTKLGVPYWVDTTIIPLLDDMGHIQQYMSVRYNITQKKQMLTELRNIEHMFRMITENTSDLIVITNEDGIILYASNAYTTKLGYKDEELIGQFYTKLLTAESREIWNTEIYNIESKNNSKIELIHKSKDGDISWCECNYTIVNDYSRNRGSRIIMVAREITERKKFENQLLFLAFHDSLTQLPNRRYIQKEFPILLEKAKIKDQSVAVLYVDGDNFKEVNDRFGHEVGDEFLTEFGNALSSSVRSNDLVVRLGGDEFCIILTDLVKNQQKRNEQVKLIIKRIKETLEKGWMISSHHFKPTTSIGISFYPDHGSKLEELLDCSDQALYATKSMSKNNYKFYED